MMARKDELGVSDWRARILANVEALPESQAEGPKTVRANIPFGPLGMVQRAARKRGVAISSYLKRSVYAMAAHDLGLPLSDFLARDSRISKHTNLGFDDPSGTRFGQWEIDRLVGEEDEDD